MNAIFQFSRATDGTNQISTRKILPKLDSHVKPVETANGFLISLFGQKSPVLSANTSMLDQMIAMNERLEKLERENTALQQRLVESSMFAFEMEELKPLPPIQLHGKAVEMRVHVAFGDAPKFPELRPLSEDE